MRKKKSPDLLLQQIQDQYSRKNFENLSAYFDAQNQLLDFKFFELSFTAAQTGVKVAHGLPSAPLDILVSRITGDGIVSFQYSQFNSEVIVMDVSGACRIRFFAGTCSKLATTLATQDTDVQQVLAQAANSAVVKPTLTEVVIPLTSSQFSSGLFPGSSGTNYAVRATLDDILLVNCSTATRLATLPLASQMTGRLLWVKKVAGAFDLTIASQLGETVEGASTLVLAGALAKTALYCNGTTYYRMV